MEKFDVVVIGSGMAGMTAANKCAAKGLKVAITDSRPYGGTCALRGCDPKKVLIGAAEVIDRAKKMKGKGVEGDLKLNWQALMQFKESFTDPVPEKLEKGYEKAGITTFHGAANFLSPKRLKIGNREVEAEKFVVATGARPVSLPIEGSEYTIDSTDFLNLKALPERIAFIGGGYIAFEFAHLAARAGVDVTIIQRGARPLENFEPDIVQHLVNASKELGIKLLLNTEARAVEKTNGEFKVVAESGSEKITVSAGLVVNAAGRVPEIDELELEKAGVTYNKKKGIEVNDYLQSVSNSRAYAAGDVADTKGLPLTPVAVMEGHTIASNIIKGNHRKPNYMEMPTVVFSLPPMASVGLTEEEAKEKGLEVAVKYQSASQWFSAKRIGEETYAFKTLTNKKDNKLVGAHLTGPHADEVINLFAMAIKAGLTTKDIKSMVYAYPTVASDLSYMV